MNVRQQPNHAATNPVPGGELLNLMETILNNLNNWIPKLEVQPSSEFKSVCNHLSKARDIIVELRK